jgi:ABC-type branched-subunit amino acid transport system substrate-binding protein
MGCGLPLGVGCGMIASTTKTPRGNEAAWVWEVAMKRIALGLLASTMVIAATTAMAQSKPPLKLGAILDMSGLYADITGSGSETAAKMAAEDFGGEVLGRKIEIIAADHLNKADLSANIARDMLDNQGVEAIVDVAASATALAALEIAKARNKIIMCITCSTPSRRPTPPVTPRSSRASTPGSSSPPTMRSGRIWKRTPPMSC